MTYPVLPDREAALMWLDGMSEQEAAEYYSVHVKTIRSRWSSLEKRGLIDVDEYGGRIAAPSLGLDNDPDPDDPATGGAEDGRPGVGVDPLLRRLQRFHKGRQ